MHAECEAHQRCIATALNDAERLCRERGVRFTPLRRQVFELIWQNHKASRAYELLAQLQVLEPRAKPPTVYRALDFLIEQGLIHRIESINGFIGCDHLRGKHAFQLLICQSCGTVQELHLPEISEQLASHARTEGFDVHRQTMEATGICRQCRQGDRL